MVLWWPPVNLQSPPVPRGLTDGSVESSGRISARCRSSGSSSLGTGPSIPNCMRVTLPPKNVSLAEWFNASNENGNDEDSADALHAGIQGGSGLGVVEQTLFNWVKADRLGKLTGADSKAVSAEQMEISRLRAELARV